MKDHQRFSSFTPTEIAGFVEGCPVRNIQTPPLEGENRDITAIVYREWNAL